jgi:hypothetical protein
MLTNLLPAVFALAFQFNSAISVVKIYDGKSWSIRGLIRNNKQWDGFIQEIRSQKSYYSHGFCCYNDNFINGIQVEGEDRISRFIINDAAPNGKSPIFQMYWRPNRLQQLPDEPGYSQAASKRLTRMMREYVNDDRKMRIATENSLKECGGKYYRTPWSDCVYEFEIEHFVNYNTSDSSKYTYARKLQVYLNHKRKLPLPDSWITILDTVGYIFTVPTLAVKEFDELQGLVKKSVKQSEQQSVSRHTSLINWSLERYECAIMDKKTHKQKESIRVDAISNKCGNMCDSYDEYIILNDSTRILINGFEQ